MSSFSKHLTDDALLLLIGNRLSPEDNLQVHQHLERCPSCAERRREMQFAHRIFERLSEIGLEGISSTNTLVSFANKKTAYTFPWRPVAAILLACNCILFFLLYPKFVPEANASELLLAAVHNEVIFPSPPAFRVQVNGITCFSGRDAEQLVSLAQTTDCRRALKRMSNSEWAHGNPLSAKKFQVWHEKVHIKNDSVITGDNSREIQTTTDDGPVHRASLKLLNPDYRPIELSLQFNDEEELTISADWNAVPYTRAPDIATSQSEPALKQVDDPQDLLEVRAWKVLHDLGADNGWESLITREKSGVIVKAILADSSREQEFRHAFQMYPDIKLDIYTRSSDKKYEPFLPQRTFVMADGPPLADAWLKDHFHDDATRMSFTNDTLHLSQQIMGRAFIIDKLRSRRSALAKCSCAEALSNLLSSEALDLMTEQAKLTSSLQSVIGPLPKPPSRPLRYKDAEGLDQSIQELIGQSSNQSSAALSARVDDIRHIL